MPPSPFDVRAFTDQALHTLAKMLCKCLALAAVVFHVEGQSYDLYMMDTNGTPRLLRWNSSTEDVTAFARRSAQQYQDEPAVCDADPVGGGCHSHTLEVYMRLLRGQDAAKRRNNSKAGAEKLQSMSLAGLKEVEQQGAAIALYSGHDANIAVSVNGDVKCVLELERLFGVRYFMPNMKNQTRYRDDWLRALAAVRDFCCEDFPKRFQHGIVVSTADSGFGEEAGFLPKIVKKIFFVDEWHVVRHALAHAKMSYYTSPFRSALVVVYDADFDAFTVHNGEMRELTRLDYSLGTLYLILGALMPEVSGLDESYMHHVCSYPGEGNFFPDEVPLSWSGKLMGYSATGSPKEIFRKALRIAFETSGMMPTFPAESMFFQIPGAKGDLGRLLMEEVLPELCASTTGSQDFAASIQVEFQDLAYDLVMALLEHVGPADVDGLVITGGCALNVLTNQLIHDALIKSGHQAPGIHVPVAPNDCGLAVGGLWAITPPRRPQGLQYLGFRPWDLGDLERLAGERGALRLVDGNLTVAEQVAELLTAKGFPILAVIRGRQEFGPRALGHRSLLAVPSHEMRERMNRLKAREWYRPVAPMIAEEHLKKVFGRVVKSPYMSMAPRVREAIKEKFPALAHLDGTARHQSVSREDEPFIHALLLAVGRRTGLAALINTSFNTKGKPITNSLRESLEMLDTLPDLDYLLIEDWLFQKRALHSKKMARRVRMPLVRARFAKESSLSRLRPASESK